MKRSLLLVILLFAAVSGFSQIDRIEGPDYKQIEKAIADKSSEFYYPKLMIRYKMADTTMTLEEKRHLYYGFTFQEAYSPYGSSDFEDSLRRIFKKKKLKDTDYYHIIRFSDSILVENPFNLAVLDSELMAFDKLEDVERFNENIIRLKIVIDVLLSSGDGLKKKSAFYVISTPHEYFLLNVLGFSFGGSQSLQEHYDYLTVAKNSKRIKGFYFDVSPCLQALDKSFR